MAEKKNILNRVLGLIERVGNALPHPATLFAIFAGLVVVVSGIASMFDLAVVHPGTGETVHPVNLLSADGLHRIVTKMVTNFTGFAPLGTVLVAMLGIGIAESSGLIGTVLRLLVISAPRKLLTFVLVFSGVLSNTASEVGYVLLVPLGAIIFLAVGRHPIAGMAAAFAGVSGGYSANLLLGTIDPLLAGLSQEAASIIMPGYKVNAAANYYFMFVSTFFIATAGTWVTERIVIPRLGEYKGDAKPQALTSLTKEEKRGLRYAIVGASLFAAFLLGGVIPETGYLRNPKTWEILHSPFMDGIVAFIFLGAAIGGIAYGIGARTYKSDSDVMKGMGKAMEAMGVYIVLVFFASQFVAFFRETNLGLIVAIEGAAFLKNSGLGDIPLLLAFILLSATINLFIGSASAKWAVMAPVFIPMLMLLGYSPELVQGAYRVGDSVTNIISPMMSYFALIVAFVEKYEKNSGIGTVISTMLPYSVVFLIIWSILFIGWILLDLPLGPDARLYLNR
ncbi:MAG: AbgT family transporter [Bacteroidetes bacterium]|nr:AbgT family transporter [Bacteroidota bacterium]MCW5896669.1 AbgT family transporter [Bacteroidota bacterium]